MALSSTPQVSRQPYEFRRLGPQESADCRFLTAFALKRYPTKFDPRHCELRLARGPTLGKKLRPVYDRFSTDLILSLSKDGFGIWPRFLASPAVPNQPPSTGSG